ncbi:MAG: hypothetical protein HYT07_00375 [Candidatus Levybacteria bacterium]|nr:hypothetical protein [Candidatus Levybacteria bacterium]
MLQAINTKVLLSAVTILAAAAIAIGATFAFFSDTETSTGNVLAAGAIDLKVDNTCYYNGNACVHGEFEGTDTRCSCTWEPTDLSEEHLFFDLSDIKPGDWEEDTISLAVENNEAWLCADVTLTSDDDNSITEPEAEDGDPDTAPGIGLGELADAVNFYWWADDGDNVFECVMEQTSEGLVCNPDAEGSEHLLPAGPMGNLDVDETATVALADSDENIWGLPGPIPQGGETFYIGKAWCFGDSDMTPYPQGEQSGPDERPVTCDGSDVNNITQTDSFTADIAFRAVQARNNDEFQCEVPTPTPS